MEEIMTSAITNQEKLFNALEILPCNKFEKRFRRLTQEDLTKNTVIYACRWAPDDREKIEVCSKLVIISIDSHEHVQYRTDDQNQRTCWAKREDLVTEEKLTGGLFFCIQN